jgi:drug/metabolite transporter (DMT)-like permease
MRAKLGLCLVVLIWGATFPVVKSALSGISPMAFLSIRFVAATALFYILFRTCITLNSARKWRRGISLGGFLALGMGAQTAGLLHTTASRSAFITGLSVVFVAIFAIASRHSSLSLLTLLSVCLSAAGLYLMTNPETRAMNVGDWMTLLGAGAFGVHIFLINLFSESDVYTLVLLELGTLGVVFSIGAMLSSNEHIHWSLGLILSFAFLIIFATIGAYLLQLHFQKQMTPIQASLIYANEPVFAAVLSILVLGEILTVKEVAGGLLLIGAIFASELRRSGRERERRPE